MVKIPICNNCNKTFPNRIKIDNKWRTLNRRKYCLECSPFGLHNTRTIPELVLRQLGKRKCLKCKEILNRDNFYRTGNKIYTYCKKCHNKMATEKCHDNKKKIVKYLGDKCNNCGKQFPQYTYDLHHLDKNTKDMNISRLSQYSWEKIKKEANKCILLCSNCHREVHYGENAFQA